MKQLIFPALVLALSVACQKTETVQTTTTETTPSIAVATDTAAATAPYDLQFIDSMSKHHQMAVEMVKMAEPKFEHKELRDAAKKMLDDQNREIAQLKSWRDQWYAGAAPAENMQMPGMSSTHMDMSHMQSMTGNTLDIMFIDMMIPHHEGAVVMARDALSKAEHQEIKDFSQKVIDAQASEIEQMKTWKAAWAKSS